MATFCKAWPLLRESVPLSGHRCHDLDLHMDLEFCVPGFLRLLSDTMIFVNLAYNQAKAKPNAHFQVQCT